MKYSIDSSKEIRLGLEGGFSGELYPAAFVPLVVEVENADTEDPWEYEETWIAFYFSRFIFPLPLMDKDRGYFNNDISLCMDDYLTCYCTVGERYVREIVDLTADGQSDIFEQIIENDEDSHLRIIQSIASALLKSEKFKNVGDLSNAENAEIFAHMVDYRKVY